MFTQRYYQKGFLAQFILHPFQVVLISLGAMLMMQGLLPTIAIELENIITGISVRTAFEELTAENTTEILLYKLNLFIMQAGSFGLVAYFIALGTENPGRELGFIRPVQGIDLLLAAMLLVTFLPLMQFTILDKDSFTLPEFLKEFEQTMERIELEQAGKLDILLKQHLWLNLIVFALVPAIFEELFFRGLLLRTLLRIWHPHIAIWVVGVIFSLLHLQFYGFIPRMLLGILFGYLCYWSGSLLPAVMAHFTNNGLQVLLAWFSDSEKPSEEEIMTTRWGEMDFSQGMTTVIALLFFLCLLFYFHKRNHSIELNYASSGQKTDKQSW